MPTPQNDKNEQDWKEKLKDIQMCEGHFETTAEYDVESLEAFIESAIASEILKDRVQTREKADRIARSEERDKIEAAFHSVWELTANASDYTEDDYNVLLIVAQWCKFKLPPNQTER